MDKREEKGITLAILIITLMVMVILAGTTIYTINKSPNAEELNNMYADIENLDNNITLYYSRNGELPIKGEKIENIPEDMSINSNDNENYYEIDLGKLENVSLNFGKNSQGKDVYIINEKSHTIYYLAGIAFEGEMYYTSPKYYEKIETIGKTDGTYSEDKGVNTPIIYSDKGMQLVKYENGQWVEDTSKDSYSYVAGTGTNDNTKSQWANAKVTIDGVESFFVWVPRYAYKITYYTDANKTTVSTDTTPTQYGTIDVKFIKGTGTEATDGTICKYADDATLDETVDYIIHPAFTKNADLGGGWTEELAGLWIGKYETSLVNKADSSNITTSNETIGNILLSKNTDKAIAIQANRSSWRYCTIGNIYTNAYYYSRDLESHMLKNSEWGAVAYLTHSQYGRNGHEIAINSSELFITGTGETLASSTGNEYGIYDLRGGASEYVAAYYNQGDDTILNNGSSFASTNGTSTAYVTAYYGTTASSDYKKGDATYETSGWHDDLASFIYTDTPFFVHGAIHAYASGAGVFYYYGSSGASNIYRSFRICLAVQ